MYSTDCTVDSGSLRVCAVGTTLRIANVAGTKEDRTIFTMSSIELGRFAIRHTRRVYTCLHRGFSSGEKHQDPRHFYLGPYSTRWNSFDVVSGVPTRSSPAHTGSLIQDTTTNRKTISNGLILEPF